MLHGLGEVNPNYTYYNVSCISKDTKDPNWSISSRPEELRRDLQHWKSFGRLYFVIFVLVRNIVSLNSIDREHLEANVSLDEIKSAIWDCGSNKAPGPDGLMPQGANSSFFTLIPKRGHSLVQTKEKKMLIFKVEFEKAFDSVSWKYLDFVLHSLGFGNKWRSWIKECLHSFRASILVNGSPTSEFSIKRGLRHGDPLLPFLFILVMEGLHYALSNVVNSGLIQGINLASGLKINIHKSNIYGIGVSDEEFSDMATSSGCILALRVLFPFSYLGLPIGSNKNCVSGRQILIDRPILEFVIWLLHDMIIEISLVDTHPVEYSCLWSMEIDGLFSVRTSRRIIDAKLLPSLVLLTSWDKILPHK
ncbi:RNA-directed DNA polymerase, eukaryota, reverse transcriptase zinc-binding domain protein, partial [Tanacetum coccineum]